MNHRIVLRGIFALGLSLLLSAAAQAQAFRTYLSGSGNDANPCSLVAPCRLLPAAMAAVIDGGEIWMLDSANYNSGPVNVEQVGDHSGRARRPGQRGGPGRQRH